MKRFILHLGCLIFLLSVALHASAFTSDCIVYHILSEDAATVEVASLEGYEGDYLSIPEQVVHDGKTYSVTAVGDYAFGNWWGLTSVTIPETVTTIGDEAFAGCSSLTSVTIPETVTSIGDWAFAGCSSLTSVYCKMPEPISCTPKFSNEVLAGAVLYVPLGCKLKYETVKPWSGFAHIEEMDYSGIVNNGGM